MPSWYAEGESKLEWTQERADLLLWILNQKNPGWYGVALLRLQKDRSVDVKQALRKLEIEILMDAMDATNGNISQAAFMLGLERTTMAARLRKLGLARKST